MVPQWTRKIDEMHAVTSSREYSIYVSVEGNVMAVQSTYISRSYYEDFSSKAETKRLVSNTSFEDNLAALTLITPIKETLLAISSGEKNLEALVENVKQVARDHKLQDYQSCIEAWVDRAIETRQLRLEVDDEDEDFGAEDKGGEEEEEKEEEEEEIDEKQLHDEPDAPEIPQLRSTGRQPHRSAEEAEMFRQAKQTRVFERLKREIEEGAAEKARKEFDEAIRKFKKEYGRRKPASDETSDSEASEIEEIKAVSRKPIIFKTPEDNAAAAILDHNGRRRQRINVRTYFTVKIYAKLWQHEIELPDGISTSAGLLILVYMELPLQCFNTQNQFEPDGLKIASISSTIREEATPFANSGEWMTAVQAFRKVLAIYAPFELSGLLKYEEQAMEKLKEIELNHHGFSNFKEIAFKKFLIFDAEVRRKILSNHTYEWGNPEVWTIIAKRYPSGKDIPMTDMFRPTKLWVLDDGTRVGVDTEYGRKIGLPGQSVTERPVRAPGPSQQRAPPQKARGACDVFNDTGTCNATNCPYGHYCSQYRTFQGEGCGPNSGHAFIDCRNKHRRREREREREPEKRRSDKPSAGYKDNMPPPRRDTKRD